MAALVMCARVESNDPVKLKPGVVTRPCRFCGANLWVSQTTLDLGDVFLACNPCGKAALAASVANHPEHPVALGIAPGALNDDEDDRLRRAELERHGFRDLDPKKENL